MRKWALVLASLCSLAVPAVSKDSVRVFLDGNNLLERCSGAGYELGVCAGYVMAIADAMHGDNSVLGYQACMDVEVQSQQVVDIVVAALRRSAAVRHLAARGLVAKAIAEAFPCPSQ
jgi:hypothetical protein